LEPEVAYQCGAQERVGQFFNPTEENIQRLVTKINELKVDTIDSVNHSLFRYFETAIKLEEPHMVLWRGIWAYFSYLVKEGIIFEHLQKLSQNIIIGIGTVHERNNNGRTVPIEKKIITMSNYFGLLGIIDSIEKEEEKLKPVFEQLRSELKKFMKKYTVQGIKKGEFSEIFPILESKGGNIGRKDYYPEILKNIWGYIESPFEIESRALTWLNDELPKLNAIKDKLAKIFNIDATLESVEEEISKRNNIQSKELLQIIEKLRKPLRNLMEKNIVRITPEYDTRVMETPGYLLNLISTAAMKPYDIHTEKPFNVMFVTTEAARAPATNLSSLFQLIIHEEFGHCVHFSNSATKFNAKPTDIELIYTNLALPISDGISFYREWEALTLIENILTKPESEMDESEQELYRVIKTHNNPNLFLLELKFIIYRWRIIRFLRAIGDIRINMHKQSIAQLGTRICWPLKKIYV
jgi:hypothetical protein